MNPQRKYAILDRFFGAVEAGDIETAAEIYAPNVGIWHNFDGVTQSREESLRTLRWMCKKLAGRCYEEIRRAELDDGRVFQQHVLRGKTPNGDALEVPACIVVTFDGERIARVEEYLDSAQVAVLRL